MAAGYIRCKKELARRGVICYDAAMKYPFESLLTGLLVLLSLWSYTHAYDGQVWWTEMAAVLVLLPLFWVLQRRRTFSPLATSMLFLWFFLQVVGACYTFERVPLESLFHALGCERNHYDRIAHFVVGLNAVGVAELLWRQRCVVSARVAAVASVICIMALANFWELVEWLYAEWDGGSAGAAFLGSQGDIWDAQKDMLMDTLGAVVGAVLYGVYRRMVRRRSEADS